MAMVRFIPFISCSNNSTDIDIIFIIEGLVTIFFSIFVFNFVPNFPARDKWLKKNDQARLLARLEADKGNSKEDLSKVSWKKVFLDYRVWLM